MLSVAIPEAKTKRGRVIIVRPFGDGTGNGWYKTTWTNLRFRKAKEEKKPQKTIYQQIPLAS